MDRTASSSLYSSRDSGDDDDRGSGSEGEDDGGDYGSDMGDDQDLYPESSSPIIPMVSATQVMLGQTDHLMSGDQGMSSGMATTPQSSASTPQVYLQLPTGQSVPVHIPAESGDSTSSQPPQQAAAMTGGQQGGALRPTSFPSPGTSTTASLKQRLKQTLQAHTPSSDAGLISPTSSSASTPTSSSCNTPMSSSSFLPSPSATSPLAGLRTPISTSTQVLLHSPSSSFNLADLEPVSKRPKNGSIETDDPIERRQKFLERNRAAAARCRHKRKQWIVNLEKKADELQQTNSKLQGEVGLLKGEVAQLKTLLLAHQNCPISIDQHISVDSAVGQLVTSSSTVLSPVDSLDTIFTSTPTL